MAQPDRPRRTRPVPTRPEPPAGPEPDTVALTDLSVIARYSLALRVADAPRDELVRVLRDDLTWLTETAPPPPARAAAPRRTAR